MTGQTNMDMQKISVATAQPKAVTLHGVHALVITSDTPTIVSPRAHQLIILKTNPLKIVMDIALHAIVVALILAATLMLSWKCC